MFQMMCHGSNLIPENLETGEYKIADSFGHSLFDPVWCVAYLGDKVGNDLTPQGAYVANGMSQTVSFLIATSLNAYNNLMSVLNAMENASDYIMSCFSIPRLAVVNFLIPAHEMESFPRRL